MKSEIRKTFFCLVIIFTLTGLMYAQSSWTKYGWQIYDNAGDARSIAMGNTSIADNGGISVLWNPAIDNSENYRNFIFGHQSRFAGIIQSDLIAFPFSFKNNRKFNIILLHESVTKIPNTQNLLLDWGLDGVPNTGDIGENNGYIDEGERLNNENITYFNQRQIGLQFSTQFKLYGFDFGIAIKSLFHTLGDYFGSGIGLNIGMTKSFWKNSNIGLAVHNLIPGMIVWDSGHTELSNPLIIAGISQSVSLSKIPIELIMLSDIIFNVSNKSLSDDFYIGSTGGNWRIGAEISYNNKVNIRFGRSQYGLYSTGLGISWTNFELNYAYQLNSKSVELGTNHVLSFTINPKWFVNKLKQQKEE
ncbi:MAG: hypothetical protein GWP19_11895 [Planctomycetia bacterium]|nr:hypothetical protein [Planctomycetia bacterium]